MIASSNRVGNVISVKSFVKDMVKLSVGVYIQKTSRHVCGIFGYLIIYLVRPLD